VSRRNMLGKCLATLALVSTVAPGCGDDTAPPPAPSSVAADGVEPAPASPAAAPAPAAAAPAASAAAGAQLPPIPPRDVGERDFLETSSNRDPFRSFEDLFVAKAESTANTTVQREVLVAKYALEELKVVGIIAGNAGRVLVADPTGLGWILRVGDFVAKPEVLQSGGTGASDVAVNWRLDRIRDNDVVFVREDPSRPDVPPTTRVLSLHSEDELNREIRTGIRGARPGEGAAESGTTRGGG
jgi:type IV pilus assembly protein PilP